MIHGPSHIVGEVLGAQPTMNQAGADAEKTGAKLALGGRFKCPRLGYLTRETCLANFQAGHSACTTGFVCGIGRLEAEKEGLDVGYSTKKGDCACGTKDVRLDKDGRCYKCQAAAREEARRRTRMTPAAPGGDTPPVAPAEATPSAQEACGDDQRVGPRVEEVDEDAASDVCQGWPETDGRLAIEGMEFEVVPVGKNTSTGRPFVAFRSCAVAFSADAVRAHGLDKFTHIRMHKAPGVVCFELLTGPGANVRKLHRQRNDSASMACTVHKLKEFFPGASGRRFDLEATERPGFFLARVG